MATTVSVVGGGLVGSMVSCFLAKRGFDVDLYEMRADIRTAEHVQGKSINLALSERGRSALRSLGLEERLLQEHAIPMRARLIHDLNGTRRAIPYGRSDQAIYSVGRRHLNELLLDEAEKLPNVRIHFEHKNIACDFRSSTLKFENANKEIITVPTGPVIGCDGAHSAIRRALMKATRLDFSQTYIDHGYIELNIPATASGEFAMEINYLHIWARGTFMLIALPNQDHSYTVTLFMPFEWFDSIDTDDKLLQFFGKHFPDAVPLIGEEALIRDFFATKASSLVSVKCSPLHYGDKALLIGDAAHAMVPFFGQGMNCGFEDCLVIDELFAKNNNNLAAVFAGFTETRNQDCHVICDLAMYNYYEMRHLVNSVSFLIRKKVDVLLHKLFPASWIPLYGMVTFTRLPYADCVARRERQDRVLRRAMATSALITAIGGALLLRKYVSSHLLRGLRK